MENLPYQYDHIFCACGTGATLAGIAKGAEKYQRKALIHGVPVLKGGDFILEAVGSLYPNLRNVKLHTEYHFGGYAKTKASLITFIQNFCSGTGMLIEPVYTGKVFYALLDLIEKDYFNSDERILIIHTGGLTGFLGNYKLFAKNH
jgi:1-aminocyclopropane-1-carboxylate deaminase